MAAFGRAAYRRVPQWRAPFEPVTRDRWTPALLGVHRRLWPPVTKVVLGTGVAVVTVLVVLLLPVIAAVMIVGCLVFRDDVVAFVRSFVETVEVETRVMGLVGLAVASCLGWHLLLGPTGVAVVLVDLVGGLPLLAAGRGAARRVAGTGAAATRRDRESGPAPAGLDELVADLSDVAGDLEDAATVRLVKPRQPPDDLDHLSDAELRHAWNASSRALLMAHNPAARLRIVAARAKYLEAMEQRDPERFARWARGHLESSEPPGDLPDLDGSD